LKGNKTCPSRINEKLSTSCRPRYPNRDAFEEALTCAKAELDEDPTKAPRASARLKIELNDTTADLWSTAGVARALRVHGGGKRPSYGFFSREGKTADAGSCRVVVDPELKSIRPYIAAFVVSGKPIDEETLKDVIQTQEKLCWNFGRKRRSIAMGVYRTALMKWPVHYAAADPDKTRFVPLGMAEELSLRESARSIEGPGVRHIVSVSRCSPTSPTIRAKPCPSRRSSTAPRSARWRSAIPTSSWR
jgi:phenylalanyl-tRNA synthetase beta chain